METFYMTDKGKVREINEDNVIIIKNDYNQVLLAVADGMGGHNSGEVASFIAINHLENEFSKIEKFETKEEAVVFIRRVVTEINDKIFKHAENNLESKGMGTTLVLSLYSKDFLLFGNIGDSCGMVIKEHKLFKVTKEHTLINLLISTGKLSEENATNHPKKNIVMKALGAMNPAEIDIFDVDSKIDGILLCSDGLTNMLSITQIEKTLNLETELKERIKRLIIKCNNRGGNDNISVACLINKGR